VERRYQLQRERERETEKEREREIANGNEVCGVTAQSGENLWNI
jgi:hypothetical protein